MPSWIKKKIEVKIWNKSWQFCTEMTNFNIRGINGSYNTNESTLYTRRQAREFCSRGRSPGRLNKQVVKKSGATKVYTYSLTDYHVTEEG